jgi:adenylate cyclase class IV
MFEVEIRGRLKNFEDTLKKFKSKAKFIEEKDRFSLVYFRNTFQHEGDVREVKDDPVDLRVRVTNKKAEIIMKYGKWGGSDKRKEISIPISLDKFEDSVDLLKCLDWYKGVVIATKTFVFDYKGIEFALVKNKDYNYFEAEKLAKSNQDLDKISQQIKEVCREFNLEPFDEEDFMDQINKINNSKENQFDFSKQDFRTIKSKFGEFF